MYKRQGISHEDRVKERNDVLATKIEDIRGFSNMVSDVMKQNFIVVLGNESKINDNRELFGSLENVFN